MYFVVNLVIVCLLSENRMDYFPRWSGRKFHHQQTRSSVW